MNESLYGNIHSFETFGTVDGPGIRFVIFFQGCPLRCLYCHNPDTWTVEENKKYSVQEVLDKYLSLKEFCKGGMTATGGEPLLQIDFLIELFHHAKKLNIHTTIDTSGICFNPENIEKIDKLLKYTDLILLDIKHIDDTEHKKLTGHSNRNILSFAKYLSEKNFPVWIRHVVVEGLTDKNEYLEQLGDFLSILKNIKALDVLPYHDMGKFKYKKLGIDYPLKNTLPLTKEQVLSARNKIIKCMKSK